MKNFLSITLIFVLAFMSCKKDKKNDTDCSLTEAHLAGSYKVTSIKYQASATSPEVNFYDIFPREDCEKDDITTFKADHTVAYTDAGTVCSPDNSDVGQWTLAGNVLTVDGEPGTIETFTCTGFTAIGVNAVTPGDKVTAVYTKQ